MRITFILPGYFPTPIGGYRVIYEHADFLAARGHIVTVAFARPSVVGAGASLLEQAKKRLWASKIRFRNKELVSWHRLHPSISLALVPEVRDSLVPDGDIVVATGWSTAQPVAALSRTKGLKFYFIQGYETWAGPREEVDATWRLPLRKIVVSKWLQGIGEQMGLNNLRHIPNGIDHRRFQVTTPVDSRSMSILSIFHTSPLKGIPDALAVLKNYHEMHPRVRVSMFGVEARGEDIPDWIQYYQNPSQDGLARDIYNQHAVYLSASLLEGWALPPAEAMACGCAFVGTDSGGCRDYAIHDDTALLSPASDRDGLLRNLVKVTEDAALRSRIQRRGTENIRQFTWEAAGSAMEQYFMECVSDR
jgi:glycosyltransferase involved in cell wall biosynthesis